MTIQPVSQSYVYFTTMAASPEAAMMTADGNAYSIGAALVIDMFETTLSAPRTLQSSEVIFADGGSIVLNSKNISFAGSVSAPFDAQIFSSTTGSETITIPKITEISPCWFGAGIGSGIDPSLLTQMNNTINAISMRTAPIKVIWPSGFTFVLTASSTAYNPPTNTQHWCYGATIDISAQTGTTRGAISVAGNVGSFETLSVAATSGEMSVQLVSSAAISDGQYVLLAAGSQFYDYSGTAGSNFQLGEVHKVQGLAPNFSGTATVIPFREPVVENYRLGQTYDSSTLTYISGSNSGGNSVFVSGSGSWPATLCPAVSYTSTTFTTLSASGATFVASSGSWPATFAPYRTFTCAQTNTPNDGVTFTVVSVSGGVITVTPNPSPFSAQSAGTFVLEAASFRLDGTTTGNDGKIYTVLTNSGANLTCTPTISGTFSTKTQATVNLGGLARLYFPQWATDIEIRGLTIIGTQITDSTKGTEDLMSFSYVNGLKIIDCVTSGGMNHHIYPQNCINIEISGNRMTGLYYDGVNGADFYAIYLANGCQWFDIHDNSGDQFRHLIECSGHSGGQNYYGRCMFGTIQFNKMTNAEYSASGLVVTASSNTYDTTGGYGTLTANTTAQTLTASHSSWTWPFVVSGSTIAIYNSGTSNDNLIYVVGSNSGGVITLTTGMTGYNSLTANFSGLTDVTVQFDWTTGSSFAYEVHGPGGRFLNFIGNQAWGADCLMRTENFEDGLVADSTLYGAATSLFTIGGSGAKCARLTFSNNHLKSLNGSVVASSAPEAAIYFDVSGSAGVPLFQDITFSGITAHNCYSQFINPKKKPPIPYNGGQAVACTSSVPIVVSRRIKFVGGIFDSGGSIDPTTSSLVPAPVEAISFDSSGWSDFTFEDVTFKDWQSIALDACSGLRFWRNKFNNASIPTSTSQGWLPSADSNEALNNEWTNFYEPIQIQSSVTNLRLVGEHFVGFTTGPIVDSTTNMVSSIYVSGCTMAATTPDPSAAVEIVCSAQQQYADTNTGGVTVEATTSELFDKITNSHTVTLPLSHQSFDYWDVGGGAMTYPVSFAAEGTVKINGTTNPWSGFSTPWGRVRFTWLQVNGGWHAST